MDQQFSKDFTPPASPTSGLQEYDQEDTRRRKKINKDKQKPTQCEDQNGDTVNCNDENISDDDDGADETHAPNYEAPRQAKPKQNPNDTDELSAKGARKVSMDDKDPNAADAIGNDKDANESDSFDNDPNATGYGKTKTKKGGPGSGPHGGGSKGDKEHQALKDKAAAATKAAAKSNEADHSRLNRAAGKAHDDAAHSAASRGNSKEEKYHDKMSLSHYKAAQHSEMHDTGKSDEGNMQKVDITTLDEPALEKFFKRHEDLFKTDELVKGVYDVACLGQLIFQLKGMADNAAYERQVEGDDSAIPENIRDEAAKLLSILSDMASEESQEITDGSTMEDVMRDTQPTMTPGLYRTDVGPMAKALRQSLFGVAEEDLEKAGARNSAKDLETLQKCHDALCELGANCKSPSPHDNDGNDVSSNTEVEKMGKEVSKTDTVMSEGNKRGAAVSDPKPGENSSNAVDAEDTADQGQEKPVNDTKKSKKRMDADTLKRKKAQADMDEDEDEDEDDDSEDDEDEDDAPPPKAKKKAKKSFDAEDLAKVVATAVATAMAGVMQKGDLVNKDPRDPRSIPNLMAVGKNGDTEKFEAVDVDALKKSVQAHPGDSNPDLKAKGDNGTATLIKAIHKSGNKFRLSPSEIPQT